MLKPKNLSLTVLLPVLVGGFLTQRSAEAIQGNNGLPKGFNKVIPAPQASAAAPRQQPGRGNGNGQGRNHGGNIYGNSHHHGGLNYAGGYFVNPGAYYQGGYSGYPGAFGSGYYGSGFDYYQTYRVPMTYGMPDYYGSFGNFSQYGYYGDQTQLSVYPNGNLMPYGGVSGYHVGPGNGGGFSAESQTDFDQSTLTPSTMDRNLPVVRQPVPPPDLSFPIILTKAVARSSQQRAERAFRNGQYQEAARLANQVIVLDSDNGLAWLFASHTKFATGDFTKAAEDLRVGMSLVPEKDWSEIVKNFRSFYGQNDYVKQMDRLNQFIENNPQNIAAKFVRGHQWASLGYARQAYGDLVFAQRARPQEEAYRAMLKQVEGQLNSQTADQQNMNGHSIIGNAPPTGDPIPFQSDFVPAQPPTNSATVNFATEPAKSNPQPARPNDPFGFDTEDQEKTYELLPPGEVVDDIQLPRR